MKRVILSLLMSLCLITVFAQSDGEHRAYCNIIGTSSLFSSKVKITVDFGQETSFWKGDKDQQLVDESGQEIKFNSMVDAMNYMGRRGWKFIQAYAVGDSKSGYVYTYLLYKDVQNDDDILDGIYTKEIYKSLNPTFNCNIKYVRKRLNSSSWEVMNEEYKKDTNMEELQNIVSEWEAKSNDTYEYKCQLKREK